MLIRPFHVRPFRGRRGPFAIAAFLLLSLLAPAAADAQDETTRVVGTVRFAQGGAPAVGASVAVLSTTLQAYTDDDGRYVLVGLAPGRHRLVASFLGQTSEPVEVDVPRTGSVTIDLELDEVIPVEGVVVSASRNVKIVQDVPASVSVVTPEELERRAPTIQGEELAGISNVAVRDNSEGSFTTVRIRGVPSSHQNNTVLALVDGVPFVTGGDEVDLERLVPASLIQRIEVVKGPTSALYGRGGVSGAINYVTRPAFGATQFEASLQGGSFGYLRPSATLSVPLSSSNQLLLSGFYEEKDGVVRGARRQTLNLFAKNEWTLSPVTQLTIYANVYDNEQGASNHVPFNTALDPVVDIDPRTNFQIPNAGDDRSVAFASARLSHRLRPGLTLSTVLHARHHTTSTELGFSETFDVEQNAFFWNGFGSEEEDDTWFIEPQLEWDRGRVRVTAGANWESKSGTEFNVWTGENGFPTPDFEFLFYTQKVSAETGEVLNADRFVADTLSDYSYDGSVGALFAQIELDLSDRLMLGLGGRYDRFSRDLDVRRPVDGTPTETISDEEGHFSPKVSLTARVDDDLTVYGAFGEGFNPAFGPPFVFSGRPADLKPEVARNYEIGAKGSLADGRVSFSVAGFRMVRNDLLLTLFTGEAGQTTSVNAGEHRSTGFEAELFARLTGGFTSSLSYGHVNSKWIDNRFANSFTGEVTDWSGNEVAGVPAHTLSISVAQAWDGASVALWWDWRDESWIDNDNTLEGGGFGLFHASASAAPTVLQGAEIRLTAKNLLDKEYFYFFPGAFGSVEGYRGRPFELVGEVRYRW